MAIEAEAEEDGVVPGLTKTPVSKEFALGINAAYALVKHIEDGGKTPFKSMLQVTTTSPTEALACYMRTFVVEEVGVTREGWDG